MMNIIVEVKSIDQNVNDIIDELTGQRGLVHYLYIWQPRVSFHQALGLEEIVKN